MDPDAVVFDPGTIKLMRSVLDEAWGSLPPHQRATTNQTLLAARILAAAKNGERDPIRLRAHALISIASGEKTL